MEQEQMKVWYLDHSGFAVETRNHLLIFDYYKDCPGPKDRPSLPEEENGGLERGVVLPQDLEGRDVVVFASHSHGDHFNRKIFQWRTPGQQVRYVLAGEITAREEHLSIAPGERLELGDLAVEALESTDLGVAFLVEVDRMCLYHAGDLNWWHWEGEPREDNLRMGERYRREIDRLRNRHIDLALVPVDPRQGRDPRQEGDYRLGIQYFLRATQARVVVPMHFWGNFAVFDWLEQDLTGEQWARVKRLSHRGESFVVERAMDVWAK